MTDYVSIYDKYMQFIVPDATSRILGQQSIGSNIKNIHGYWQQAIQMGLWGKPDLVMIRETPRFMAFRVNNIMIGGYKTSLWFWGLTFGHNTVVTKVGFWSLAILPPIVGINTVVAQPIIKDKLP